ncbi:hypothetical protein BDV40DRAFT_294169 [Aspergillus tamarii]|uniref:Uncharacterized protein n=1 Tax=Aspergillus tamarii TaxID=41984 RepID=A0A5N6UAP3_ASPTM|nr:hypothetical protein BDV40DRAFT_294169 [Aspergillus tamarii]
MRPKTDTSWLDVDVGENGSYVIRDYRRLDQVVSELTQPRRQHPFLSVFLGGKNKDIVLQAIFLQNNIRRIQSCSRIGLRYDIISSDSESPILFADGNVTSTKGSISSTDNVSRLVYAQLIFLFADLVYLFADNFLDLMSVAYFLVDCVSMRSVSAMPVAVRLYMFAVLMGNPDHSEHNGPFQQFYQQFYKVDSIYLSECFFNVNLFLNQRENIQIVYRENWSQVNTVQLGALFMSAIRNLVSQNQIFFDFVNASREWNPVEAGLSDHVAYFLEVGYREECKLEILLFFLASALILDHCLSGMMLFRYCQTPRFSKSVPDLYYFYVSGEQLSFEYRRQHLLSTNYKLCRVCCYTICNLYPQLFGNAASDAEYQFSMVDCLLCNSWAVTTIDILFSTMNPTVLAIDGGGICERILLEYLLLIQESLGPEYKLADLVDLAVRSSSGKFRLSISRSLGSLTFLHGVFFASVDNPLYRGYFA